LIHLSQPDRRQIPPYDQSLMTAARKHALPRAILFDMDGTLTEPLLDFPRIKAEMGIGQRPILEALAEMDEQSRHIAELV